MARIIDCCSSAALGKLDWAPAAASAFDELKQGVTDIETLADPASGEVRIGCPEGIAAAVVAPILRAFLQEHPRVVARVNALPPSIVSGLQERKHDLVLTRFVTLPSDGSLWNDLKVKLLFDDPLLVMTSAQSPWTRHRKVDLAKLIDEAWLLTEPGSWNFTSVTEAFKARGLAMPKIVVMAGSVDLRAQFLAGGRFIAPFALSNARMIAERYPVKALTVDWKVRTSSVAMITLKNRTLNPTVERFIEHLRKSTRPIRSVRRAIRL